MVEDISPPRPPGTEIVPRDGRGLTPGIPSRLLAATDLAVGAGARTTRLALRLGGVVWDAGAAVGQVVSALPGAEGAGRLLSTAARPLVDEGQGVRVRARSGARVRTQRLLEELVPGVLDALDIDRLVQRIDIDRLVARIAIDDVVSRIDIDALVRRIDIDQLVRRIEIDDLVKRIEIDDVVSRIDIDALVRRIDVDAVVERIDVGRIAERIDVNEVVQRVDVDAIVEETELGTIVARSTSGFASAAVDAARSQTAVADTRVSRVVNRFLRRRESDLPAGPPLLAGRLGAEDSAAVADGPPPPADAPEGESGR
jgi:hypothetical protein